MRNMDDGFVFPGAIVFKIGDGDYISLSAEWDAPHDALFINGEEWQRVMHHRCTPEYRDCGDGIGGWYCSCCDNYIDENDNYCHHCGAVIEDSDRTGHDDGIVYCKECQWSYNPYEMNDGYIDEAHEYPGSLICGYMEMDVRDDGFCAWGERG